MIAVLSPAKTLDYETRRDDMPAATEPRFATEASHLAAAAAKLSKARLAELMHISDALADLNADRYRRFEELPKRAAIQAFDGDVYDGLGAKTLDRDAILFAQDHLRIFSGMYGMLRPLDGMRPYRLEMGTKWAPRRGKITDWWQNRVADLLMEDLETSGSRAVLNLASVEYWSVVEGRLPVDLRIVDVGFRAADGRFITFHAKVARGVMSRWMIEHRVTDIDDMRGFDSDGYSFDAAGSEPNRWLFKRNV